MATKDLGILKTNRQEIWNSREQASMIITELYNGQGFGNQLWVYVSLRALAKYKGYDFGIAHPERFKGDDFMSLDFGLPVELVDKSLNEPSKILPQGIEHYYAEQEAWHAKRSCDVRNFDTQLLEIPDNCKVEGNLQSEDLILPYREQVRQWLQVKPEYNQKKYTRDNLCILNIRGGEYKGNYDLLLPKKYWIQAMANMRKVQANMEFMIVTDDPAYARWLLPGLPVEHSNLAGDYCAIHNARHLILANTSFAFFAVWTSTEIKTVIAPKYWAQHNVSDGYWSCAYNLYRDWQWQDRHGRLFSYDQCQAEYQAYLAAGSLKTLASRPLRSPLVQPWKLFYKFYRGIRKLIWMVHP